MLSQGTWDANIAPSNVNRVWRLLTESRGRTWRHSSLAALQQISPQVWAEEHVVLLLLDGPQPGLPKSRDLLWWSRLSTYNFLPWKLVCKTNKTSAHMLNDPSYSPVPTFQGGKSGLFSERYAVYTLSRLHVSSRCAFSKWISTVSDHFELTPHMYGYLPVSGHLRHLWWSLGNTPKCTIWKDWTGSLLAFRIQGHY